MKAISFEQYGGPEVLQYSEVETPRPKPGQVRVRVHASSVNAADYRLMRANPFLARLATGLFKPTRLSRLGSDVAGVVEELGDGVRDYVVGDRVFGNSFVDGRGAFAEQVCVSQSSLCPMPTSLSFEDAAAVPLAAVTALQGLRDVAQLEPGESVLLQGAGGGVGLFAVQVAKALGAEVTAVCGAGSLELALALGADRALDYARVDFPREDGRYDVIVAINGYHPVSDYKRCLKPGGRYAMVGGANRQIFEALLLAPLTFLFSNKRAGVLHIDQARYRSDLEQLSTWLASGQLTPTIDRSFSLADVPEAIEYVERGHVRGKVVIAVPQEVSPTRPISDQTLERF